MYTSDQELTKQIEKHRIFGIFTATGVINAAKEISKIECIEFLKWFTETYSYIAENIDFEKAYDRYIQRTSASRNTNQVSST